MTSLGITLEEIEENRINVIDAQREFVVCCPKENRTTVCNCPRPSVSDMIIAYTGKEFGHHDTKINHYHGHNVIHDAFGLLHVGRAVQNEKILYTLDYVSSFGKTETAIRNKNYTIAVQSTFIGFLPKFKRLEDVVSKTERMKLKKIISVTDSLATIESIIGGTSAKQPETVKSEPPAAPAWTQLYGFIDEQKEHEQADISSEDGSDSESGW